MTLCENFYFYRLAGSDDFCWSYKERYDITNPLFVRINPVTNEKNLLYKGSYSQIESYDKTSVRLYDGEEIQGFVVEYIQPFNKYFLTPDSEFYRLLNKKYSKINWNHSLPESKIATLHHNKAQFKQILDEIEKEKKLNTYEAALMDKNGDSKDVFYIRASFDWTKMSFEIETKNIIRLDYYAEDTVPQIETRCQQFYFEEGSVIAKEKGELKIEFPKKEFAFILKKVFEMRDLWNGMKLNAESRLHGYDNFRAIVQFPYEPDISEIVQYLREQNINLILDRKNPYIFDELCSKLNIQNFRGLRKLFLKNPLIVAKSWILESGGIHNKDILKRLLDAEELDWMLEYNESAVFFLKEALKRKNEAAVCSLLLRESNVDFKDCIEMFFYYYSLIDEEFVTKILEEGFTAYNHDVLAKISRQADVKNQKIHFTAQEKKFNCKVKGYSFCLLKTTDEIKWLGFIFKNCVASYAKNALRKKCTIIYAKKGDNYEMCIEVRHGTVMQARQKYNAPITTQQKSILFNWMKLCNLECEVQL